MTGIKKGFDRSGVKIDLSSKILRDWNSKLEAINWTYKSERKYKYHIQQVKERSPYVTPQSSGSTDKS